MGAQVKTLLPELAPPHAACESAQRSVCSLVGLMGVAHFRDKECYCVCAYDMGPQPKTSGRKKKKQQAKTDAITVQQADPEAAGDYEQLRGIDEDDFGRLTTAPFPPRSGSSSSRQDAALLDRFPST